MYGVEWSSQILAPAAFVKIPDDYYNHNDPFDLPDDKKKELRKKMKKVLTKKEVFDILDKEIEKIESLPPSTWGFTRDDIIEAIENIKDNLEGLEDE